MLSRRREGLAGRACQQLQYAGARAYSDESARAAARERLEGRIRDATSQRENLERRIREADVCPICYEDQIANKTVTPCCSNSFCLSCITRWLMAGRSGAGVPTGSCPLCKTHLRAEQLMVVCPEADQGAPGEGSGGEGSGGEGSGAGAGAGASEEEVGADPGAPFRADSSKGKIDNLRELVRHFAARASEESPRRVLIFSDNDEIMSRVSVEVLRRESIPHAFLKSNAAVINARTRDFRQTRGVHALLINVKYYGSGMDLSAATDIVLMHKVKEGMAAQVIGRAQRPPRTDRLRIWKFRNDLEDEY